MDIKLSDHFDYNRLIRFTAPSIFMMIFASIYSVVDGFFVSNYVGNIQFASLNLIFPFIMVLSAFGFMFGAGGSALVALTFGSGDDKKANEIFSLIIYTVLIVSTSFAIIGYIVTPQVAKLLGASEEMLPYCILYARISFIGMPFFMLQNAFQTFMITAERPTFGFLITVAAGITNMILDFVFMGVLHMGLGSAAAATVLGQIVGGFIPLIYFIFPNTSKLRLCKTRFMGYALLKTITNGSSEFLSNVSASIVNMLYNFQLMKFAGELGVSAFGIIMYTNFIFVGVFFGYSMGASPIAGYNLGAENYEELQNVFKRSIRLITIVSIAMTCISELAAKPLTMIFASSQPELLAIAVPAMRIYALSYLFCGFNIFSSSFFTAMNNGKVSAIISSLRLFLFQLVFILVLPIFLGINGIWGTIIAAEVCSLAVTIYFFLKYKNVYHYM